MLGALFRKPPQAAASTRFAQKILDADVQLDPFPHIVIYDLLDAAVFDRVNAAWPSRDRFWHESGHDRYWCPLVSEDHLDKLGGEWRAIKREILLPMVEAMAIRLRPWYGARFRGHTIELRPRHLQLHESGPSFVEHGLHNHFVHNPEYAFTWLLCVDDNDFEGRGTTLYGQPELTEGNELDCMLQLAAQRYPRTSTVHVPFKPNRLLAFVDAPRAMHGSNPFDTTLVTGHRRLIQSHIAGPETDMRGLSGSLDAATLVKEFADYTDVATAPTRIRELAEAEVEVEKAWRKLKPTSRDGRPVVVHPS